MARVDLHLHTEFSPDSLSSLEEVVRAATRAGLTHLAVTDHNRIDGALRLKEVSPLPVIAGEEIMTAQGEVVGLFLSERVPPGMSALDTARAIREQGGLVYVPHPMDPFRHGLKDAGLREVAPLTDVVEVFNARCVRGDSNRLALEAADSLGLAQAAASDSHSPGEIGRSYVEGPDFDDPQGLLRMLRAGKMVCRLSPKRVHLYSRLAALRRLSQGGRRG